MPIKDKHDPRAFQHYAKIAPDGSVLAIVEIAAGSPAPTDGVYADVTPLYPYDLHAVTIDPALVKADDRVAMTAALSAASVKAIAADVAAIDAVEGVPI